MDLRNLAPILIIPNTGLGDELGCDDDISTTTTTTTIVTTTVTKSGKRKDEFVAIDP